MRIKCEHCGQDYEVDAGYAGQEAVCTECGKTFVIRPDAAHPSSVNAADVDEGLILGLYRRKGDPIEGGMGRVFRVHHTTWNVDLAIKQPLAELFQTEAQKQTFINECDAWIDLGLHPHIVSCYYVREIDGVPSIFAEWMDGGSLSHWIRSEKLYEGDDNEIIKRILDIAIQFAWGLDYAHEQKLIHQDVKPDNVMLTSGGDVKVADFGIAKAKAGLGLSASMTSQFLGTMISKGGFCTEAYCSPEQANGGILTRRTDIWSWAVSVMEMFGGERVWRSGVIAGAACEEYFDSARVSFPEPVKDLLRECFREDQAERPHDFKIIADKMLEIYRAETGKTYERVVPEAAADAPDSLNNRALSYIDMGQPEKAEQKWDQALSIDSAHLESTYNQGLYLWRSARIDDAELVRRLETVRQDDTNSWRSEYLLAMVHLDRGDAESAERLLESAASQSDNDPDVVRALKIAINLHGKGRCLCTFEGYTGRIKCVNFIPDGEAALSGSEALSIGQNTLKLWDLKSGQCLRTFMAGYKGYDYFVNFSPDGKSVLSGSPVETLKLWDVASGQCLRTFKGDNPYVKHAHFSPDCKSVLTEGWGMTLKLWDVESGQCLRTFKGHTSDVHSINFSPDGKSVLSGSNDTALRLWDVASGQCLRTFEAEPRSSVYSVCFSPDGKSVLSGSFDNTLRLWDVASGQCLRTFEGHTACVFSVSFSPDGKSVLSGSDDNTLRLWDVASGQCLRTFEGHTDRVTSVTFSPDGKSALSGSSDSTVKLWDVTVLPAYADWALCRIRTMRETLDHELRFTAALQEAAKKTGEGDITVALAALAVARSVPGFERTPQCLRLNSTIGRHCRRTGLQVAWAERTFEVRDYVTSVTFSPDGKSALSGGYDNTLKLWDVASGQCLRTFEERTPSVTSVSFSPDGKSALSGSGGNIVALWDVASGQCLRFLRTLGKRLEDKHTDVDSVVFSPDGRFALSSPSTKLQLWDVESGQCLRTFEGHKASVLSVDFSADGKFALSGSGDNTLKLWDVESGQCLRTFEGHKASVLSVDFSADGKFALSGSIDTALRLWDAASGQCLRTFEGHIYWVYSVSFSPDGNFVLSGSRDKTLKLWDVASGRCLRTFKGHTSSVHSVSFSPDGNFVLSGSHDETLKLWRLDWDYEFPGWVDWDDGAEPYLRNFLTVRNGIWNEEDFTRLINNLQNCGYGWLRPEGVRRQLEKMTAIWQTPPKMPREK